MSKKLNQLKAVFWIYIAIVGGYVLYSYATKSGLYALIIDEQLKLFGKAEVELAVLLPFVVLVLPIAGVASYIRKQEKLEQLRDPQMASVFAAGLRGPAVKPEKRSYWIWLGLAALMPFLTSLGAYFYLTATDSADQRRHIYHMDLERGADLPARDIKFVDISGVFQQDSKFDLIEDNSGLKSRHSYGPLTAAGWSPGQPVKYFLYLKSEGDQGIAIGHFDSKAGQYQIMPPSGPFNSTFGGQLTRNGLPDYVKAALQRRGITTEEPYYVLEWMGDLNGPVGSKYSGQMYYLIPVLGAFFSLVVFVGGGIAFINRRRQRRRAGS